MSSSKDDLPNDLAEEAKLVAINLLPEKSRERYGKEYSVFQKWLEERGVTQVSEDATLVYFSLRARELKPSTLWSKYSMLRSVLNVRKNIDIKFPKLVAFLKRQASGYAPKKSLTLERDEISRFLADAPGEDYLHMKIALLFGICGACRCEELVKMDVKYLDDRGDMLIVILPVTKTKKKRTFIVSDDIINGVSALTLYRKYKTSRQPKTPHSRFFVNYCKVKPYVSVIGKNTMAKIPFKIATFLKLKAPKHCTGHCFRRTSATLLVKAGGDLVTLKQHGGWESGKIAEGYVAESLTRKKEVASQIITGRQITSIPSSSKDHVDNFVPLALPSLESTLASSHTSSISNHQEGVVNVSAESGFSGGITFNNLTNCTINLSR